MPSLLLQHHDLLAYAGLSVVVFFSLGLLWDRPGAPTWLRRLLGHELLYAAALLVGLLLFRWPGFFVQRALNPDEAQFIAGAMTLWLDPVFWRSVDGQTAGPFIYYALTPLKPLGLLNYTGARLVGCLLVFGTLWFSYRSLRSFAGEAIARPCLLPAFCFFAFTTYPDFVHYSSEHVPMLLLAIGLSGLATVLAGDDLARFPNRSWLLGGAALGAVPFAKLQAVPPAAALLLTAVAWVLTRRELNRRQRWAALGRLSAALCLVPAGFALMLTSGGAWESFWNSYFVDNWAYLDSSVKPASETVDSLAPFLLLSRAWCLLIAVSLAVAAVALARPGLRGSRRLWPTLLMSGFLAANIPFTLFVHRYAHYLLFLVMPAVLLAGVALADAWLTPGVATWRRRLLAAILGAGLVAQVTVRVNRANPFIEEMAGTRPVPRQVARAILREVAPGDRMAVWGWHAELHVETGLPQATSNSNSVSQITPSTIQDYFVERYASELRRTRPRIFVDAVGPTNSVTSYRNREIHGHECFPAVGAFIAENYTLVADISAARIYRRTAP